MGRATGGGDRGCWVHWLRGAGEGCLTMVLDLGDTWASDVRARVRGRVGRGEGTNSPQIC